MKPVLALAALVLLLPGTSVAQEKGAGEGQAAQSTHDEQAAQEEGEAVEQVEKTEKAGEGSGMPDSVALLTGGSSGSSRKIPFGGFVLLEQQLGSGTFVSDQYARNPYYAWLLSIRPRYFFTDHIFAELRIDLRQELTTSFGTSTTKKRQLMPSDTLLTFKWQNAYTIPVAEISISPYVRLAAPTSYESRYRDLYIAAAAGFDLTRLIGPVYLVYSFRFSKNFHKYTVATVPKDIDKPVAVARSGGAEDLGGAIATGDNNVSFSVFNSIMASFLVSDEWTITLQWAMANGWTYNSFPKDDLSSAYADAGRGQSDAMYGVLDVTYQPWKHVGFSMGISTKQLPKSDDNKHYNFPWWDFRKPAENNSVIYFDVFATY